MLGVLLAGVASALEEISCSIGKRSVRLRSERFYTFGFFTLFCGALILVLSGVFRGAFFFDLHSLPVFLPRLGLELLQAHVAIKAIIRADRGDYGVLKMLTIPLLLCIDLFLGYSITPDQFVGIGCILIAVIILLYAEKFSTKGFWLLVFLAANAAITISLQVGRYLL
jgi:hypothetical protein